MIEREGQKLSCQWKAKQNESTLYILPPCTPSIFSPDPPCAHSDTVVEHLRTRYTVHTSLPLHLHFPVLKMHQYIPQINISMIHDIPRIAQDANQPRGHSSEPLFPGNPDPSTCLGLHVPLTVMQFICRQRLQMWVQESDQPWQTLYLARRCCFHFKLVRFFYIMWFTIKFQISSFAGEEKKICHIFTWPKSFGAEQHLWNRQALSGQPPSLVSPLWVYQLSLSIIFIEYVCACMHMFPLLSQRAICLCLAHSSYFCHPSL